MKRPIRVLLAAALAVLTLAGCGQKSAAPESSGAAGEEAGKKVLVVGATPVPHAQILRDVVAPLLAKEGIELQVKEFTDYVQPNLALADKLIDANFFQHIPYLEKFSAERNLDLTYTVRVHIEPMGVYSQKVKSLAELPDGATVAIPNDPTNAGRALVLLAQQGLLKLKEGVGFAATVNDIVENPKGLKIKELEAAQLPRALADVDAAVINTNYALEAGLNPAKDALAIESGQDNPYANVLAVRKGDENRPEIQALSRALTSPEVKEYIEKNYQGAVVPAF
ncbi:MAG: MetQ/NlpA family ABC transporter substrate-binding protein [Firmicutes bacterium]|nr:MetQ/NlpA family ABC transporter substrate-binding protein [Bacillota bacterium]